MIIDKTPPTSTPCYGPSKYAYCTIPQTTTKLSSKGLGQVDQCTHSFLTESLVIRGRCGVHHIHTQILYSLLFLPVPLLHRYLNNLASLDNYIKREERISSFYTVGVWPPGNVPPLCYICSYHIITAAVVTCSLRCISTSLFSGVFLCFYYKSYYSNEAVGLFRHKHTPEKTGANCTPVVTEPCSFQHIAQRHHCRTGFNIHKICLLGKNLSDCL